MARIVNGRSAFGASGASNVDPATLDILLTTIQAPTSGKVEINFLNAACVQNAGAFKSPTYIPLYVLLGGKGQTPPYGDSTTMIGIPSATTAAASGLEMKLIAYFNLQSQTTGLVLPRGTLVARDGQSLYVCTTGLVDGTTSPATLIAAVIALTVLGSDDQSVINATLR